MRTNNPFQNFKDEIERIKDDLDTLQFLLDQREHPGVTIASEINLYKSLSSELDTAFKTLEDAEGDTHLADIPSDFRFRN